MKVFRLSAYADRMQYLVIIVLVLSLAACKSIEREPCYTPQCMQKAERAYHEQLACDAAIAAARKRSPGVYRIDVTTRSPYGGLIGCRW